MTNPNNVINMPDKQSQPLMKYKIRAVVNGFPVTIKGEGRADMELVTKRLIEIGAEPPAAQAVQPAKQNGAPTCPVHNIPMAPSKQRAGTYYCKSVTGQAEDGRTLYCTKKA